MTVAIQAALVRIWDNENQIAGAGFLVTENHVLTCAHVVSDALGRPRQEMPAAPVLLDFPFVEPGKKVTAVVTLWQPKRPDGTGDIAGLELQASLPDGARPLRLVNTPDTWNHPFRAFGFPIFPSRHDEGVWASGVLRDRTVNGHIHIEDTKTTGYSVQPGFSGTAVWDETLHGVIGMVATAESKAETKAAFIISTDMLVKAWPDLRSWAMSPNPYRGLKAFRQEDTTLFFGRETFVEQLETAVAHKSFVAVIGASGSGKSSVVFAGLLPKVGRETTIAQFRPGNQPFYALVDALLPIWQPDLPGNERLEEARKLAENLQDSKTQLLDVVNDISWRSMPCQRLLLVADQFEELYTLCPLIEMRQAFIRCLVTAVQAQTGQHHPTFTLLLTMRADFMGQATEERPLADALQNATYILGPMTREELAAAVERPAQAASVQFEPGLIARILDDVGDEPGNLPLLEFALTLLWEKQTNGLLTHADYEAIGEVEGALARYAEEQFAGLTELEQVQARLIFTQLVQPGRSIEDTRRQAMATDIGAENWGLVKWLADTRLVVTNRNEAEEETAEIVHEVLMRCWQRLRGWMNEDRRFREWQERLREAMRQWQTANMDESALLRGTLLAEAEDWLAERSSAIQQPERVFIEKSVALRERTRLVQTRRRNVVLTVSLLATVLFAVLGLFSYGQSQDLAVEGTRAAANEGTAVAESTRAFQNEGTAVANSSLAATNEASANFSRQLALGRQLAAESITLADRDIDIEIVLLLAVHAARAFQQVNEKPNLQVDEALRYSLAAAPKYIFRFELDSGDDRVYFSGDQAYPYTFDSNPTVDFSPLSNYLLIYNVCNKECVSTIIVDIETGEEIYRFGEMGEKTVVTFNPQETQIVIIDENNDVSVLDVLSGKPITDFESSQYVSAQSNNLPFNEPFSEKYTVAINYIDFFTSEIQVWRSDTDTPQFSFEIEGGYVEFYDFTLDERFLVAVTQEDVMRPGWLHLIDITTGELYSYRHLGWVSDIEFSRQESLVATVSSSDRELIMPGPGLLWDISTGQLIKTFRHTEVFGGGLTDLAINNDGTLIATAGIDNTIRLWERSAIDSSTTTNADYIATKSSVQYNGIEIDGNLVHLQLDQLDPVTLLHEDEEEIDAVYIVEDSSYVVTISDNGMHVWNLFNGELNGKYQPEFINRFLSASADVDRIAAYSGSDEDGADVWDLSTNELIATLPSDEGFFMGALLSPDGKSLAMLTGVGFARRNSRSIILWNVDNETVLAKIDMASVAAFSPDSQVIAVGTIDGSVYLLNTQNGEQIVSLDHTSEIASLDISSDGKLLASGSRDGAVQIWDVNTYQELTGLNHESEVTFVKFNTFNNRLFVSTADGNFYNWIVDFEELIELACSKLTRNFTYDEWQRYVGNDIPYEKTCPNLPVHPSVPEGLPTTMKN